MKFKPPVQQSLKSIRKSIPIRLFHLFLFACTFISCVSNNPQENASEPPTTRVTNTSKSLNSTATIDCSTCNCTCPGTGTGAKNYSGQTLRHQNFAALGSNALVGANFSGATLIACNLDGMNLKNANFSGAILKADSTGNLTGLSETTLTNTCFTQATLSGVDLQYAIYQNTDFTCADISTTKFGLLMNIQGDTSSRTKFNNAHISMANEKYLFPLNNFEDSDWAATDFDYTQFNGLLPSNFITKGRDMSYARFAGLDFSNFDMTGCILSGADCSYTTFYNATLDSATCHGTNFLGANLEYAQMKGIDCYVSNLSTTFYNAKLNEATLTGADLRYVNFTGAKLINAILNTALMQNCNMEADSLMEAATVTNASFRGANLSNSRLNHVYFNNANLIGAKFQYVELVGTTFTNLPMSGADFSNAALQGVDFSNSYLYNASFKSATLSSVQNGQGITFDCTYLGGADFTDAIISKASFSNAAIPDTTQCCPQKGGGYNCGTDSWVNAPYGATILPNLKVAVDCPNGQTAICEGNQWYMSNNYYTVECGDNSNTRWSRPNCSGNNDTTIIVINDPQLKQCLDNLLFGGEDKDITPAAASLVDALDCAGYGIEDLSGLQNFHNLRELDLSDNKITSDDIIKQLSSTLSILKLANNQLTSIEIYDSLYLEMLDVSNNQLNTITIARKNSLFSLDLSNNKLSGDNPLFSLLLGLTYLDVHSNSLTSVGDLSKLLQPGYLYLSNNQLETIGDLSAKYCSDQGTLITLDLSNNPCFQCSTLDPNSYCKNTYYNIIADSHCECIVTSGCSSCDDVQ